MRSTFKVLFYVNGSKEKNGVVPIMGRVTINGSVAQFSCKQSIHKDLWDVKGNRAKGKSKESRDINLALDNMYAVPTSIYGGMFFRNHHNWADEKLHFLQKCNPAYLNLLVGYDNELMLSESENTI